MDFDDQGDSGEFAIAWYDRLWNMGMPADHQQVLERTPGMLNDKVFLPLQAADMLAWSARKHVEGLGTEWDWLWEELKTTVWAGYGFDPASWEALADRLGL